MAEYIERTDLEFPYMTMAKWGLNIETCHAYNEGVKAAADYIASIPAADVAPVVRCKDCAWYRADESICVNAHCTKSYYGCRVRQDHYCSFGERKGDEC